MISTLLCVIALSQCPACQPQAVTLPVLGLVARAGERVVHAAHIAALPAKAIHNLCKKVRENKPVRHALVRTLPVLRRCCK